MQKETFVNNMYNPAVQKIRTAHDFYIREAIDKADLSAIVDISKLTFARALADCEIYNDLKTFFRQCVIGLKSKKIGDEYDYIMQGSVSLCDVDEAADFLAACKLFIKYSSEYSICVNNGTYTFHFNVDRIDGDIYNA